MIAAAARIALVELPRRAALRVRRAAEHWRRASRLCVAVCITLAWRRRVPGNIMGWWRLVTPSAHLLLRHSRLAMRALAVLPLFAAP